MAEKKDEKIVDAGPTEIANKPNEPAFKLALNSKQVTFACPEDRKPVSYVLKLYNGTGDAQSFKVKCTSAEIFRVQPPLGLLKPYTGKDVVLWFQNKARLDNPKHYFAFYHVKADNRTAKEIWASAKPDGVRRLPAVFEFGTKDAPTAAAAAKTK